MIVSAECRQFFYKEDCFGKSVKAPLKKAKDITCIHIKKHTVYLHQLYIIDTLHHTLHRLLLLLLKLLLLLLYIFTLWRYLIINYKVLLIDVNEELSNY